MDSASPLAMEWKESLGARIRAMRASYFRYILRRCFVGGSILVLPLCLLFLLVRYVKEDWEKVPFLFQLIPATYLLAVIMNVLLELIEPRSISITPGLLRIGFGSWSIVMTGLTHRLCSLWNRLTHALRA